MAIPTIPEVRAYLRVPATSLSDADLTRIYGACQADQANRCHVDDPYPDALGQAFLRRIQREVAARNLPLGLVGADAAEFAPARIPMLDALIAEHETPYRIQVVA